MGPEHDQTDPSVELSYSDYSEYDACDDCDNNVTVRFRHGVNMYDWQWSHIYIPGQGWTWVHLQVMAGWQYAVADGDGVPYSPSSDLCDTNLENFCDSL